MKKWFFLSVILFLGLAFLYRYEFIYLIDVKITLLFETLRTTLLTNIFLFLSEVGSIKYMFPICIFFTILLLYKKRIISALFLFILLFSVRWINSELKELFSRERCVLQNKSAEYCKLICRCYFTWSGGHDSLSWQSQPLILLASWLETHARRGSMSSCNIV